MSNALLHLPMIEGVPMTQKYLEKGHTQMECDSVHAKNETAIGNCDVHLPSQLATITQSSRQHHSRYRTKILSFNFFRDYSKEGNMTYTSIRPGKNPNEPQVIDIRSLHYDPAGEITYKLPTAMMNNGNPFLGGQNSPALDRWKSSQSHIQEKSS